MTSATYEDEACIQVQVIADAPSETASPAAIKASYSATHSAPVSASSDKKEVVKIEKASKQYVLGEQEIYALKEVSLNVQEGEFLALAGPSGSGKSTLLNLIGCIDTPDKGKVWIAGHNVEDRSPDQLSHLRAETIGFIFQTFNLLPVLSAWENVEYPLLQSKKFSKAQRKERVGHFLELVGLGKQMRNRPNELSGGQRQRVAIARALATDPSIVLADEPTANLDHKTGEGILELMQSINQEHGTTFVFSTHDSKVMEMAGRVVMLCDGEIEYERHWMESRAT
ncbi:MAG: ABC transporter ATP-binding protein [Gammaproteobacteria bacterium]|nr:ABC transporter ATP-binding protein [Gammaproteobacteria bacterium]NHN36745.1 ABC transporter ATP-binding protein [Pseudomaricurvus alcaniphilus]